MKHRLLLYALVTLVLTGCCGLTGPLAELIPNPLATATPVPIPTPGERPKTREAPEISRKPEPIPTATPVPEPVAVVQQGFGQDGRKLAYGFIVENPNPTLAVDLLPYEIALFDEDGDLAATDAGYVQRLLPDQELGVAGSVGITEGVTVAEIRVRINEGAFVAVEPMPGFATERVTYVRGTYRDSVTGVITNPYSRSFTEIRVTALAFNDDGTIIGSGFTYVNVVLAQASTGVDVSLTSAGEVVDVALYPATSGLTAEGAAGLAVIESGYGQRDRNVGYGFLIENPSESQAMEDARYRVTAYGGDGRVLATDQGYGALLLPGQTLGVGGKLLVAEGETVDRLDAQVLRGDLIEPERPLPFAVEEVAYRPGDYSDVVTGRILNPYDARVSDLRVFALAYNRRGAIVGGGDTYLDVVPAGGHADVEVSIAVGSEPATVELYANLSGISEFR